MSNLDINRCDGISSKAALKEIVMGMNVSLTPQLEAIVKQKINANLARSFEAAKVRLSEPKAGAFHSFVSADVETEDAPFACA